MVRDQQKVPSTVGRENPTATLAKEREKGPSIVAREKPTAMLAKEREKVPSIVARERPTAMLAKEREKEVFSTSTFSNLTMMFSAMNRHQLPSGKDLLSDQDLRRIGQLHH